MSHVPLIDWSGNWSCSGLMAVTAQAYLSGAVTSYYYLVIVIAVKLMLCWLLVRCLSYGVRWSRFGFSLPGSVGQWFGGLRVYGPCWPTFCFGSMVVFWFGIHDPKLGCGLLTSGNRKAGARMDCPRWDILPQLCLWRLLNTFNPKALSVKWWPP